MSARSLGNVLAVVGALMILSASPLSAQWVSPIASKNLGVGGAVSPIGTGSLGLQIVGAATSPVDPSMIQLGWDFSPVETWYDPNDPPGSLPRILTPTPADAAALTYRMSLGDAHGFPPIGGSDLVAMGVTCSDSGCHTPANLLQYFPQLKQGGIWTIRLTRAKYPTGNESAYSETAPFETLGGQLPPPVVNCVVSEWQEWSPWMPFVPQVSPPMESRHRNRTIVTAASGGGLPCPFLAETENRPVLVVPPVKTCTYMAPLSNVVQQLNVGTVIEGNNFSPTGRGLRMDQLFSWGWKVEGYPIVGGAHLKATCLGLP